MTSMMLKGWLSKKDPVVMLHSQPQIQSIQATKPRGNEFGTHKSKTGLGREGDKIRIVSSPTIMWIWNMVLIQAVEFTSVSVNDGLVELSTKTERICGDKVVLALCQSKSVTI